MDEITEITDYIQDEAGSTADVIWGHGYDATLGDKLSVTIIATGFNSSPVTGFEKAPERKVTVLEDEVKAEIVSPMNTPTDKSVLVETPKVEEPYLKTAPVEITAQIESPLPAENKTVEPLFDEPVLKVEEKKEETKEQASIEFGWDINPLESKKEEAVSESKIVHSLDDDKEVKLDLEQASSKSSVSPEEQQRLAQERMQRIQQYTARLKKIDGINDLEKEPAYVRRNIQLDNSAVSSDSKVSRFNITTDENGTSLKSNNSFLHDNVD